MNLLEWKEETSRDRARGRENWKKSRYETWRELEWCSERHRQKGKQHGNPSNHPIPLSRNPANNLMLSNSQMLHRICKDCQIWHLMSCLFDSRLVHYKLGHFASWLMNPINTSLLTCVVTWYSTYKMNPILGIKFWGTKLVLKPYLMQFGFTPDKWVVHAINHSPAFCLLPVTFSCSGIKRGLILRAFLSALTFKMQCYFTKCAN